MPCVVPASESHIAPSAAPDNETAGNIVLIMDDMGFSYKPLLPIIHLDIPVTFSILPFYPFSQRLAHEGYKAGNDIILHMPMEAKHSYNNQTISREKAVLMTNMTYQEITDTLKKSIHAVPHITGVSNHMGSRFTEDVPAMRAVLELLQSKALFFFDSQTSSKSVGFTLSKEMGIKTSRRDIFLDNERCYDQIVKQIERLAEIAAITGCAIGIGHPYPETIKAITDMVPVLLEQNYSFIALSDVLE